MKEGWKTKALEDLCSTFVDGNWIESKDQSLNGIRLIQTGNIGLGKFIDKQDKARYISEETFKRLKCTEIYPGDILISRLPDPVGKACQIPSVIKDKMITGVDCTIVRLLPFTDSNFLLYFQMSETYLNQVKKLVSGTTRDRVSRKNLGTVQIPLPPLPEQQRIVSIIDEAFEAIDKAIENTQKNLQNAKELFESYSQVVFSNKGGSWEERLLKDVCEYDKTPNKRVDLPYVGLEDIQSNTGVFLGPFEPRNMKSLTFYFNDEHVLYGRLRPYLNKVLQPHFEGHCSTEIFPIIPKKNVLDRGFLFRWLIATETMKKINATWSGATLPRANMNTVLEFPINLPSLKDQQSIVRKLDTLSIETKKLESQYQQKLRDLEELKKSVLNKAFAGEL